MQVVFSGVIFYHITSVSFCNYKCLQVFIQFCTHLNVHEHIPFISSSASIHMLAVSLTKQNFKLSVHVCSCHLTAHSFKATVLCSTSPRPQMLTLVSLFLKCLELVISYGMTCGYYSDLQIFSQRDYICVDMILSSTAT